MYQGTRKLWDRVYVMISRLKTKINKNKNFLTQVKIKEGIMKDDMVTVRSEREENSIEKFSN